MRWKKENLKKRIFLMSSVVILILSLNVIYAELTNCCPKTNDNLFCQDISILDCSERCSTTCLPMDCDKVVNCKGCCFDNKEGLCSPNSPKEKCLEDGGTWDSKNTCSIAECQKGCCILGSDTEFATEKRCEFLSFLNGIETNFNQGVRTEIECLALGKNQEVGACIIEGKCYLQTEEECYSIGQYTQMEFHKNKLCSNPNLNTNCEKQKSVGCIEGKDEIYWFDSCGNRENIYSSDKDKSWNNGEVLKKQDVCNSDDANINSKTCGNCDYTKGSKCSSVKVGGVNDGKFICGDMNCEDEKGNKRENGESWCVYDGWVGDGKDVVGSRHWRQYCIEGEIKVEPCADYRGEICIEKKNETLKKTTSSCEANNPINCVMYNKDINTVKENCEKNPSCMMKIIDVTEGIKIKKDREEFSFDVCVGKYPQGFILSEVPIKPEIANIFKNEDKNCLRIVAGDKNGKKKCNRTPNCMFKNLEVKGIKLEMCVGKELQGSYLENMEEEYSDKEIEWIFEQIFLIQGGYESIISEKGEQIINELSESGIEMGYSENARLCSLGSMEYGVGAGVMQSEMEKECLKDCREKTDDRGDNIRGLSNEIDFKSRFNKRVRVKDSSYTELDNCYLDCIEENLQKAAEKINEFCISLGDCGAYININGKYTENINVWMKDNRQIRAGESLFNNPISDSKIQEYLSYLTIQNPLLPGDIVKKSIKETIYHLKIPGGLGKYAQVQILLHSKFKFDFRCLPWQPPIGGDDCEKCNDDKLKPCSEYRCNSLGTACKLLNENEEYPICAAEENDKIGPIISPGDIDADYKFENEKQNSVDIRTKEGDCIDVFMPVSFSLNTDEYAQCKLSFEQMQKYEDMVSMFKEGTLFAKEHDYEFKTPSLESLKLLYGINITGDVKQRFGNLDMYAKCIDDYGNGGEKDFKIHICIQSGPDTNEPEIIDTNPINGAGVKFGATEKQVIFHLNEPAECRWDFEDKNYSNMINEMACETDIFDYEYLIWDCSANFTGINPGENKYYIRCKDQPWLPIQNNSQRNINSESLEYSLYGSEKILKINSVSPKGELSFGFEPISISVEVDTADGIDNGDAVCYYSFGEGKNLFYETNSNHHEQIFDNMLSGSYTIPIKCEDEAGNTANEDLVFSLSIDTSPPKIVRVYSSGSQLKVITDEEAECAYSLKKCNFNMENATSMTIGLSKEHYIDWTTGQTYYIKCEDVFGNENPGCAMKIM
ncbi:MAG: hypothetical protein KKA64_04470, partial [Nanoarchaeota archaeon]|nr:hypothetical protein [Nanoarchaeota archaeon]